MKNFGIFMNSLSFVIVGMLFTRAYMLPDDPMNVFRISLGICLFITAYLSRMK